MTALEAYDLTTQGGGTDFARVQDKLWAYGDPDRRLSKRKKDELDLIRFAEAYPELLAKYPPELVEQIRRERSR